MKLFIIATFIAISSAARLEHLEQQQQQQQQLRAYLPPSQSGNYGSQRSFGAIAGAYGTNGAGQQNYNVRGAYPSASNQYLPPDHGPSASASTGNAQFAGSINGFGGSQQYGQQGANSFAPHSSDNVPQQAFDETGYHY